MGYSPRGRKESDMTEATLRARAHTHTHTHTHTCNVQKSTVEGLRERCNKAEEGFPEEVMLELALELGFHRSRGRLVGGDQGEKACQEQGSAGIEVSGTWATARRGTGW